MRAIQTTAQRFEIALGDPAYPPLLAESPDPPQRLFGFGDPGRLVPGLAVIGARKATPYGLQAGELFAGWAARAGYTIVSGGAIGCDQAAHRAALACDAPTVAVLGCGADLVYPSNAAALLTRIAETGVVLSEHPWGTPPQRWMFRTRNRIIAGLSAVLLVLEAGLPSGTFSTADYALEAGRDVLVVPGSIFAPECRGANRLLHQGATPVSDVSELADALAEAIVAPVTSPPRWNLDAAAAADDPVLSALRTDHWRPDDLARTLALDIVTLARRIGALEASGLIVRFPDGRYGGTPRR